VDETYLRVAGKWTYLYRAVDSTCDKIDFLLYARRDCLPDGMRRCQTLLPEGLAVIRSPTVEAKEQSGVPVVCIGGAND
jgi:hypothetical protein